MSFLLKALDLAQQGYFVFPLLPGRKTPAIDDFPRAASRDENRIRAWWTDPLIGSETDYNIGISTSRFGDTDSRLLVLDVDNKAGRNGSESLRLLQLDNGALPETASARTPTGGEHYFYTTDVDCRQTAGELGVGLDTRARGGYVVAAGSVLAGGVYAWATEGRLPQPAPPWLVELLAARAVAPSVGTTGSPVAVDLRGALPRAIQLVKEAPEAVEGSRNKSGFLLAAKLKDVGAPEAACVELMAEHWNCTPRMENEELRHVVHSAFLYGNQPVGSQAPEAHFSAEPLQAASAGHPFAVLNRTFAFVTTDEEGSVVWETTDSDGSEVSRHLALSAFHKKFAAWTMQVGKRSVPVTEEWMRNKDRRSYDGFCFLPGKEAPARFYNLWRGFSVEPNAGPHPALSLFLEHLLKQVCESDEELYNWLVDFLAHLIQRPWEKPRVALVLQGGKGVGKSIVFQILGSILGGHFTVAANRRYLTSTFNSYLEGCLLLCFEEAFWSGDKHAEGSLKDLITGDAHLIEHKGREPYTVRNCTRVVILGNEDWLAPASHDERRFAVFRVGDARVGDTKFFSDMITGMRTGGSSHLLHFLQQRLITSEVNQPPHTKGLLEQKEESLPPLAAWWLECLAEGKISNAGVIDGWPLEVETTIFRDAFRRYAASHNIRTWFPDAARFGRQLKRQIPGWRDGRIKKRVKGGDVTSVYQLNDLAACRAAWDARMGGAREWEPLDTTDEIKHEH